LRAGRRGSLTKKEATKRIRDLEFLTREIGLPGMIAKVADSVDEMKAYINFPIGIPDMP